MNFEKLKNSEIKNRLIEMAINNMPDEIKNIIFSMLKSYNLADTNLLLTYIAALMVEKEVIKFKLEDE